MTKDIITIRSIVDYHYPPWLYPDWSFMSRGPFGILIIGFYIGLPYKDAAFISKPKIYRLVFGNGGGL